LAGSYNPVGDALNFVMASTTAVVSTG